MRVAINGMGRIGRLLFRRIVNHPEIKLVAVKIRIETVLTNIFNKKLMLLAISISTLN